jgi:DNA-binding MarR family transcriptional regulator
MNETLAEQFHRLGMLSMRYWHRQFRDYGPLGDPSRGQGRILAILKQKGEISQKELGCLLDMRNQSLGELLAKLEKSGYITRTPSEEDQRTSIARITSEGVAAAKNLDEKQVDLNDYFACLNENEKKRLSGYLDRIITSLESKKELYS